MLPVELPTQQAMSSRVAANRLLTTIFSLRSSEVEWDKPINPSDKRGPQTTYNSWDAHRVHPSHCSHTAPRLLAPHTRGRLA